MIHIKVNRSCYATPTHCSVYVAVLWSYMHWNICSHLYKMYAHTDFKIMEVSGENYLINCSLILAICSFTWQIAQLCVLKLLLKNNLLPVSNRIKRIFSICAGSLHLTIHSFVGMKLSKNHRPWLISFDIYLTLTLTPGEGVAPLSISLAGGFHSPLQNISGIADKADNVI